MAKTLIHINGFYMALSRLDFQAFCADLKTGLPQTAENQA